MWLFGDRLLTFGGFVFGLALGVVGDGQSLGQWVTSHLCFDVLLAGLVACGVNQRHVAPVEFVASTSHIAACRIFGSSGMRVLVVRRG